MGLSINDTAPDFDADTTRGRIRFHDWIDDSWAVLSPTPRTSHRSARQSWATWPSSDRSSIRNVKIIGLSVDATADHESWADDIEQTQSTLG